MPLSSYQSYKKFVPLHRRVPVCFRVGSVAPASNRKDCDLRDLCSLRTSSTVHTRGAPLAAQGTPAMPNGAKKSFDCVYVSVIGSQYGPGKCRPVDARDLVPLEDRSILRGHSGPRARGGRRRRDPALAAVQGRAGRDAARGALGLVRHEAAGRVRADSVPLRRQRRALAAGPALNAGRRRPVPSGQPRSQRPLGTRGAWSPVHEPPGPVPGAAPWPATGVQWRAAVEKRN